MAKKPNLSSFKPTTRPVVVVSNRETQDSVEAVLKKGTERAKKKSTFEIDAEAAHQLSFLKLETGKSKNDLVDEALNLLFAEYGKREVLL